MNFLIVLTLVVGCNAAETVREYNDFENFTINKFSCGVSYFIYIDLLQFERATYDLIRTLTPVYAKTSRQLNQIMVKYQQIAPFGRICLCTAQSFSLNNTFTFFF